MASAIGAALISTILPPLADLAMEKVKAMVVDKVNGIVNIKRDISNLQSTLRMIQRIVRVAEERQIEDDFIRNWLRDLVDIGYEARDVLDDFITYSSITASKPVNFISSLMVKYIGGSSSDTSNIPLAIINRLEKDIRSVRERFDEKIQESEKFNTLRSAVGGGGYESVRVDRRPIVGPSINKQRDDLFLGREEVKKGIMDKILRSSDDRVHVVLIWGMGGIGKTTLAQSIYNDESVKEVPKRWLCVGESKFSAQKVIREIVNDERNTGIENLQTQLKGKFEGNRFLIVLDDVWDVDSSEWDLLFNPLTEVWKGGMIIITRRERRLCDGITSLTAYNLRPLSEEDSWSIFESCAYVNGKADRTSELKPIGEEIVKKLNGHPLALKVVGRSLLNKDSSTWKKFLDSKFTKDDEVMSALRWSYNHLPRHLKMCFTYCALFPKDHVFDKKVLVQMWMAHDLIQKEEQERPEDVGAEYFEELVNASLLECVDGKYTMHDLILELALVVSNGEFANSSLTKDQMETVRHITITPDDYWKVPHLFKMEKLLTLDGTHANILNDDYFLDDVFTKLKSIRVLVLCGKGIQKIPDGISELRQLRYLDVSETFVGRLPDSLCCLYNLQTLAAPPDAVLPRNIVIMVNLRYVRAKLATCKGVGNLTSLQELSSIRVCEGDNIRELGGMQILRGKLRIEGLDNVEKLDDDVGALMDKQTRMDELVLAFDKALEKSTISEEVLAALGCPPNLTYLRIDGYNGLKLPSWMVDGKHKFDKLELHDCSKLESLPPLGELTSLKHLSLVNVGIKRLGDGFYGNLAWSKLFFPSLESLCFSDMKEWEEWDDIIIKNSSVSFFPRLTTLKIKCCAKLVSVLPTVSNAADFMKSLSSLKIDNCDVLKRLVVIKILKRDSLEDLHINRCPKLELAFEDGSSSSSSSGNSVEVPIHRIYTDSTQVFRTLLHHELVSLEYLEIRNLGGFKNFDETEANNFCKSRSLKSLRIFRCKDLKSLPVDFHKLSSLEKLYISNCPQLQSLPPDFHKLSSLEELYINDCPQLQSLPPDFHKLSSLKKLRIDDCPQLQSLPPDFHELSFLEELYINDCSQLQSLPPDFHKLSSLEKLSIYNCSKLQSLPADGLPPSLSNLTITRCPLLYERCKDEFGPDWHKINHIPKKEIRLAYDDAWSRR